ncbi:hypothetical protein K8T06_07555 [bacterium]|nr:hypothetical protein [bacterium]
MVSIDLTVFVILGMLLILNWVLTRLLFKPVMANMQSRREHLQRLHQQATSKFASATALETKNNIALEHARSIADKKGKALLNKARIDADTMVDESRELTELSISIYSTNVLEQEKLVRRQMKQETKKVAVLIRNKLLPIILAFIFTIFCPVILFATELADETSNDHRSADIYDDLEKTVNFIVMAAILYFLLRKRISVVLTSRSQKIQSAFDQFNTELSQGKIAVAQSINHEKNIQEEISSIYLHVGYRARVLARHILKISRKKTQQMKTYETKEKDIIEKQAFLLLNKDIVSDAMEQLSTSFLDGISIEEDRRLVKECISQLDNCINNEGLSCV